MFFLALLSFVFFNTRFFLPGNTTRVDQGQKEEGQRKIFAIKWSVKKQNKKELTGYRSLLFRAQLRMKDINLCTMTKIRQVGGTYQRN